MLLEPRPSTLLFPPINNLMDIVAVAEAILAFIAIGTVIFYGGRITQKLDDLVSRFDKANIPEMERRISRLETNGRRYK